MTNFHISAYTDAGPRRSGNQDSLFVRRLSTLSGPAVMAVLCDGMGGRSHGDLASSAVVHAFSEWMYHTLPTLSAVPIQENLLFPQWDGLFSALNLRLTRYGQENDCSLGSTVVVLLMMQGQYFLANIGDSRAYLLRANEALQLSHDHTVLQREIERGNLTHAQALHAPGRNLLTRCIGMPEAAHADTRSGLLEADTLFLLCSDGFYHTLPPEQLHHALFDLSSGFCPQNIPHQLQTLISIARERGETDNISVIAVHVG